MGRVRGSRIEPGRCCHDKVPERDRGALTVGVSRGESPDGDSKLSIFARVLIIVSSCGFVEMFGNVRGLPVDLGGSSLLDTGGRESGEPDAICNLEAGREGRGLAEGEFFSGDRERARSKKMVLACRTQNNRSTCAV